MLKSLLILLCMISCFTLGWRMNTIYSFMKRSEAQEMCPIPASTRALMGCEAIIEVALEDRMEAEVESWRCQVKVADLEKTLDCTLYGRDCHSTEAPRPE